jgi:hypothetical protein
VIKIPVEGELIDKRSYIGIKANICSEPGGKVLIIDEESNQQLISFSNEGTAKQCSNYTKDQIYENIVSNSYHVRNNLIEN